jgi:hypothetical protein
MTSADCLDGASTVSAVVCKPLKTLASTVASTVPRRFDGRWQVIENVASTVLDGPLSSHPHTPIAPGRERLGAPLGFSFSLVIFVRAGGRRRAATA